MDYYLNKCEGSNLFWWGADPGSTVTLFFLKSIKYSPFLMRIRILNQLWKMDPSQISDPESFPEHFFKIFWILTHEMFFLLYSLILMLKLKTAIQWLVSFNFIANTWYLCFESNLLLVSRFWLIFYPLNPDPGPKSWRPNRSGSETQLQLLLGTTTYQWS